MIFSLRKRLFTNHPIEPPPPPPPTEVRVEERPPDWAVQARAAAGAAGGRQLAAAPAPHGRQAGKLARLQARGSKRAGEPGREGGQG